MHYRKKLIFLAVVVGMVVVLQSLLPGNPGAVQWYSQYIFRPYQTFRNVCLGSLPVSIGDLLYVAGFVMLVVTLVRWGCFLLHIRSSKGRLGHSLIRAGINIGILYVLFFIGWGGNYYKHSLRVHWSLGDDAPRHDSVLFAYDRFLIGKLNALAPHYHPAGFQEVDKKAQAYYRRFTDSRTRLHGLNAKASVFGYFMQYIGIQGYYNPFTGEAQVNRFQPPFMLPFVVCHEIAHQAGVAAEGDANLLSYALCTVVEDSLFRYSAYLNSWLYTNARLRMLDSGLANTYRKELNGFTLAQIDTLSHIRKRYKSGLGVYSGFLYDGYLRLHNQKDGIKSYNTMAFTAWLLEQRRMSGELTGLIRIP